MQNSVNVSLSVAVVQSVNYIATIVLNHYEFTALRRGYNIRKPI